VKSSLTPKNADCEDEDDGADAAQRL
jgi:hypothetical protein